MKVFYYDAQTEQEEGSPVDYPSLEAIIDKFQEITKVPETFFGVEDDNEVILQFAWEEGDLEDYWLVDIPDIKKGGSYQTAANTQKCIDYITAFYNKGALPLDDCVFESFEGDEFID